MHECLGGLEIGREITSVGLEYSFALQLHDSRLVTGAELEPVQESDRCRFELERLLFHASSALVLGDVGGTDQMGWP